MPLSESELNAARAEFSRRLVLQRRAEIERLAQQNREDQAQGFGASLAGSARAARTALVNQITLGQIPRVGGWLGGPQVREGIENELAATRTSNPAAWTVGSIGGFFLPGGAKALTGLAGRGAAKLLGGEALAARAAGSHIAARGAAQLYRNLVSSGSSVAAYEAVTAGTDPLEERTTGERIWGILSSPSYWAMNLAGSGLAARYQRTEPDRALKDIFATYERVTGKKLPADVLSDARSLQIFLRTAARTPGLADKVAKVQKEFATGMTRVVEDIAQRKGAARGSTRQAAETVRRVGLGSRKTPSVVTQTRRGIEGGPLAQEFDNLLDPRAQATLLANLRKARSGYSPLDPVGPDLVKGLRGLEDLASKRLLTTRDLEAVRKTMGNMAFEKANPLNPLDKNFSDASRRIAREAYTSVMAALSSSAPKYSAALKQGEAFRDLERAFSDVKVSQLDVAQMARFFAPGRSGAVIERWRGLKDLVTVAPEDLGAMRAWYFRSLVDRITLKSGGLSLDKLTKALNNPRSIHNRQVMEEILPGVADELSAAAKVWERAYRGLFSEANSATFERSAVLGGLTAAAGFIYAMITNPNMGALGSALGATGSAWLVKQTAQSLISGAASDALRQLASGQSLPALATTPAAVGAGGGASGIAGGLSRGLREEGLTIQQGLERLRPSAPEQP